MINKHQYSNGEITTKVKEKQLIPSLINATHLEVLKNVSYAYMYLKNPLFTRKNIAEVFEKSDSNNSNKFLVMVEMKNNTIYNNKQ